MNVLGITTGRRMGNSEMLLRAALREVATHGHEVSLIRLMDYDIKPCTGCASCRLKDPAHLPRPCVIREDADDCAFVLDKILHTDGLILAIPNMHLLPHGHLYNLINRSFVINERARYLRPPDSGIREYCKVAATIGVGGSDWTDLHMPILNLAAIWLCGARLTLADQMLVQYVATPGIVATLPEAMERARLLGAHVVEELGKAEDEIAYHGNRAEICPVCHGDLLVLRDGELRCPICNIGGSPLIDENGLVRGIQFNQGKDRSHWSKHGKMEHDRNTNPYAKSNSFYEDWQLSETQRQMIAQMREQLRSFVEPLMPPRKTSAAGN
jgi:multimeric flavodoxin WrbA/uncharacterized Zn finger protein (UPF0148 family)